MEYPNLFVCLMGMGTVFFGLICLVAITYGMSYLCQLRKAPEQTSTAAASPIEPGLVAAVSAAIAEDLGTDISGIRILSIKKL